MDEKNLIKTSRLFHVLSNLNRLKIIFVLNEKELTVTEIVETLNLDQSLVSHQLKILRDFDLVRTKKIGKHIYYRIADQHVYEIYNQALEHVKEEHCGETSL